MTEKLDFPYMAFVCALKRRLDWANSDDPTLNQKEIDEVLARCEKQHGGPILAYPGMRLIKCTYVSGEHPRVDNTFAFEPEARYSGQSGDVLPLGFFKEFDLYIGLQEDLPATLIARFGNEPDEYLTFNPTLHGPRIEDAQAVGEHFLEALGRSVLIDPTLFPHT